MEIYKEGFSAVGFNCDDENFKTGVVNLSDAKSFILDITLQGRQVCKDDHRNFQAPIHHVWRNGVFFGSHG